MDLFETYVNLEENDNLHLGRLLVLLCSFGGRKGIKPINGITKFAKLDFLLRYPTYLEKALEIRDASRSEIHVADHERHSIESKMIRYRYGPWDHRYRRWINLLVGKGLVEVTTSGKKINIGLTRKGFEIAKEIFSSEDFGDIKNRALLLNRNFNLSGMWLKDFIYETFPEIGSLNLGEEIGYEY